MSKCYVTPDKDVKLFILSLDMFNFLESRYNVGRDASLFFISKEELEEVLEKRDYDIKEEEEDFYKYIKDILETIPSAGYFFEWI